MEHGQDQGFDPASLRDKAIYSLEGHFMMYADQTVVEITEDGMVAKLIATTDVSIGEKTKPVNLFITDMSDRDDRRYLIEVRGKELFDDGEHDDTYIVGTNKNPSRVDLDRFRTLRHILLPTAAFEDLGTDDESRGEAERIEDPDVEDADATLVPKLTQEDRRMRRYLRGVKRSERKGTFKDNQTGQGEV
jgi:hypothetical protein